MTKLMKIYQILPLEILSDAIVVKTSRQDIGVKLLYETTKTALIKKTIKKKEKKKRKGAT
jgi:hypothetical protein